MEIDGTGWLITTENVKNAFKKTMDNKEVSTTTDEGQLATYISQWIL